MIYKWISDEEAFVKNKYYRVYIDGGKTPTSCRKAKSK